MSKIIIHNRSCVNDAEILPLVAGVIATGRISNNGKQYCYVTVFHKPSVVILTKLNKGSDVFYVEDSESK